jgi:hypothetical protein
VKAALQDSLCAWGRPEPRFARSARAGAELTPRWCGPHLTEGVVESVNRIIYSIFQNLAWSGKLAPSVYLHKQFDVTAGADTLERPQLTF